MFAELSQKKEDTICIPPEMERTLFRVLNQFFFKNSPVDWNGRYETPAGKTRPRETPQALAPRRLPDRPRKASACSGDQRFFLQTLKKNVSASFLQSIEGYIKQ
jgi:hypothetical protein